MRRSMRCGGSCATSTATPSGTRRSPQAASRRARRSDVIGAVRAFRLSDGSLLREQLIALSDRNRELTYCLLEAPLPLVDYVATMRLRPVTDGDRTFLQWESRFRPPADRAEALSRLVAGDIYEAGFAGVADALRLAGNTSATGARAAAAGASRDRGCSRRCRAAAGGRSRKPRDRGGTLWRARGDGARGRPRPAARTR